MLIEPNSTLYLCFGVPLNPTYDGTLTFANATEQFNYFQGQALFGAMTELSYQRYDDGAITVEMPINHLYGCNYMVFRNIEFSNRWFYAFVNKVEYISNDVTKIYYTIDILQTWMFDWEFGNCFIDREHVNDDSIGANTLPEPFTVGNLVLNSQRNVFEYSSYALVISGYCSIYFATDGSGNFNTNNPRVWLEEEFGTVGQTPFVVEGNTISNIIHTYIPFTTDLEKEVAVKYMSSLLEGDFFDSFNKLVTNVTVVPLIHSGDEILGANEIYTDIHYNGYRRTRTCSGYGEIQSTISLIDPDFYYPTCKKLYTEQFMKVKLSGINGCGEILHQDSVLLNETVGGYVSTPVQIQGGVYNGCGYRLMFKDKDSENFGRALCLDSGSIVESPFTASNRPQVIGNMILTALTSAIKSFSTMSVSQMPVGNVEGEQSTSLMPYNPTIAAMNDTPPVVHPMQLDSFGNEAMFGAKNAIGYGLPILAKVLGIRGSGLPKTPMAQSYALDTLDNTWSYYYELYTPNKKDLISIDNYLNTFGYASNRIGKPNTNTRERWNYVKLKWCNFSRANMSADVIAQVKAIFERGVFLWHGAENVNNYVNVNGTPKKNEVNNNA